MFEELTELFNLFIILGERQEKEVVTLKKELKMKQARRLKDPNYINKLKNRKKAKEFNEYIQKKKQEEMAENAKG